MRIGVSLPNVGIDHGKETLFPIAKAAERLGFDSLWAAHHVVLPYERESRYPYQRSGTEIAMSPGMQWLDPIVTLSAIAAVTERARLGTSVFVLPYRNPVTLAAELAALDVLSEGRLVFGVGVGWMREEFEAIGVPAAERGARTDEHLEVMKTLWSEDPASFEGRFTRFENVVLATRPRSEGGPPIWIGGNTDPALRRGAPVWLWLARVRGISGGDRRAPRAARAARGGGRTRSRRAGAERRERADATRARGRVVHP